MAMDERSPKDGQDFINRFLPVIEDQLGKTKNHDFKSGYERALLVL
jgi:hypothetical protein